MPAIPIVLAVSGASAAIGAVAATAIGLGTVGAIAATAIGTGIIAGGMTAIQGGDVSDVLESAVKGGVTSFVGGSVASAVGSVVAEATGSTIAGAAAGGAAGTLATGGDAEDILRSGLLSGAGAGISDYQEQLRQEQFDTGMTESGLAGQTSVADITDQTVLQQPETQVSIDKLIEQLAPYQIPDTLTPQEQVNAPIVEAVTPVYETVDLPIEQQQTVAQQPEVQILIDELVKELALYEQINTPFVPEQTVVQQPEAQISIDELLTQLAPYEQGALPLQNEILAEPDIQPLPVDNSAEIAALEAAKSLVPIVVNSLLVKDAISSEPEQTGFGIVSIPGEWQQPVYNQEFTPSAPIDFGASALLAGTQWENPQQLQSFKPYNLSDLINTLNYQVVPFVPAQYQMPEQQFSVDDIIKQFQATPTFGMTETVGMLGGKPVSIADIISGIQSQYG